MEWTSIYKTGIEVIDNQHKTLFDEIYKLKKLSSSNSRDSNEIFKILNFLEEYVITHFSYEEEFMTDIGYIFCDEHKLLHENFLDKLIKIKDNADLNKDFNPSELFFFLIRWLQQHIAVEDQKYVNYQSMGK